MWRTTPIKSCPRSRQQAVKVAHSADNIRRVQTKGVVTDNTQYMSQLVDNTVEKAVEAADIRQHKLIVAARNGRSPTTSAEVVWGDPNSESMRGTVLHKIHMPTFQGT